MVISGADAEFMGETLVIAAAAYMCWCCHIDVFMAQNHEVMPCRPQRQNTARGRGAWALVSLAGIAIACTVAITFPFFSTVTAVIAALGDLAGAYSLPAIFLLVRAAVRHATLNLTQNPKPERINELCPVCLFVCVYVLSMCLVNGLHACMLACMHAAHEH